MSADWSAGWYARASQDLNPPHIVGLEGLIDPDYCPPGHNSVLAHNLVPTDTTFWIPSPTGAAPIEARFLRYGALNRRKGDYYVHHVNGDPTDNQPDNLEIRFTP